MSVMNDKARGSFRPFAGLLLLFRWLFLAALSLLCVAVFCVVVIVGETPEARRPAGEQAGASPSPSAAPLPGGARAAESLDIAQLEALFPGRLAMLPANQRFVLESTRAEDIRFADAWETCRVITLTYSHPQLSDTVAVRSAVPGVYFARFARETFTLEPGTVTLGMFPAMKLSLHDRRCFIAVSGQAVYSVEGPASIDALDSVPAFVTLSGPDGEL
jgi:hypothetical protein